MTLAGIEELGRAGRSAFIAEYLAISDLRREIHEGHYGREAAFRDR